MRLNRTSNRFNDGRRFENLFIQVALQYHYKRILRVEKAEPPVRVIGWGKARQVIFLKNPFTDFIGPWTERGGRTLFIEAKSTSEEKLPIGSSLTDLQIEWLERWHLAGAAVGVVWEACYKVGFLPIGRIMDIVKSGRRHIKFAEADPVPQGKGLILFDFVENLRRWYPEDESHDHKNSSAETRPAIQRQLSPG